MTIHPIVPIVPIRGGSIDGDGRPLPPPEQPHPDRNHRPDVRRIKEGPFITPASFRDSFNLLALERNFRQLDAITDRQQLQGLWEQLLRYARQSGSPIPEEGIGTYEEFLDSLRGIGEHLPDRIRSFRSALILLDNHHRCSERPLLVFLCAEADHNGWMLARNGFTALESVVREDQFEVLYVEAGTDREAEEAVAAIYERTGRRIHTLMVAGHGDPRSIRLGDPEEHFAEAFIDPNDFRSGAWAGLDAWMEQEGQIILLSCSTGAQAGGETSPQGLPEEGPRLSMHNYFAGAAPGRRVLAPVRPICTPRLTFDDATNEAVVVWSGGQDPSA